MHMKVTVPRFGTFRAYLDHGGLVVEDLDGQPAEVNAWKAVAAELAARHLASVERSNGQQPYTGRARKVS